MIGTHYRPIRIPTLNGKPLLTEHEAELILLRNSGADVYYLGKQEKENPELYKDLKGKVFIVE